VFPAEDLSWPASWLVPIKHLYEYGSIPIECQ
jgi:hypothetical protein